MPVLKKMEGAREEKEDNYAHARDIEESTDTLKLGARCIFVLISTDL